MGNLYQIHWSYLPSMDLHFLPRIIDGDMYVISVGVISHGEAFKLLSRSILYVIRHMYHYSWLIDASFLFTMNNSQPEIGY